VSAGSNPAGGTGQRHKFEYPDNLDAPQPWVCDLRLRNGAAMFAPHAPPKRPPLLLRRRSWHIAISAYEAVAPLSQAGARSPTQLEHNGLPLPRICARSPIRAQMCSLSGSHNASAEFPDLARRHTGERLVRRGRVFGAFGDLRADGDRSGQADACLRGADAGEERRHRRHAWRAGGSTVLLAPRCSTHAAP
jgi:hypothetical protein